MGLNINPFIAIFRTFLKYKYHDIGMKLAFASIAGGITLLVSGVGLNILVAGQYFDLPVIINNNLPGWLPYLGAGLVVFGCIVGILRLRFIQQQITGILIVHRGMEGMNITDVRRALPGAFAKGKFEIIDLHEGHQLHNGNMVAPERALDVVNGIDQQIKTRINGRDNANIKLAYGGLAPIPLLVTAGYKMTSRQECLVMDYSRTSGWHGLDDVDDEEGINIMPPVSQLDDVVAIVLPLSVAISTAQIPDDLSDKAYVLNLSNGPRPDSLNSSIKQKRIATEFYTLCANLKAKHSDIKEVHVFLASQASFAFRLGTMLSSSVMPKISIYQYDTVTGNYGWGVSISARGNPLITHIKY